MEEKHYFYDYKYYSIEELSDMYSKLSTDKRKVFRDSLSHYTLAEILSRCNYNRGMIHTIWEIAGIEADRMEMIGSDCGVPLLYLGKKYDSTIRKLINLTGDLVLKNDDERMNNFKNGELFLHDLICLTIDSYEKNIISDFSLIDYESLSKEECLAIADNFVRFMKNEELVYFDSGKVYKKINKEKL